MNPLPVHGIASSGSRETSLPTEFFRHPRGMLFSHSNAPHTFIPSCLQLQCGLCTIIVLRHSSITQQGRGEMILRKVSTNSAVQKAVGAQSPSSFLSSAACVGL